MLLDPRAMWTRDDIAEYMQIDVKTVDRVIVPVLPPTSYIGRLPRWLAGSVMEATQAGLFARAAQVRQPLGEQRIS